MNTTIRTTMNSQPKTCLEIINETFNWTDTMQNLKGQPQCVNAKEEKQDEYQAEPVEDFEMSFTSEELYEILPNLAKENIEALIKKYKANWYILEKLEIILQWKQDQETPTIGSVSQALCEMDNETLLKNCTITEDYRRYCDKCTDAITSSWSEGSVSGLYNALDKAEKEVQVFYYEIDRRCYLGTWIPEKEV